MQTEAEAQLAPPNAKIIPTEIVQHGDSRSDPYAWMREKTHPDVVAYLEAENAYTQHVMRDDESTRKQLYREMLGRIQETDQSAPERRQDYLYYVRTEAGKQYGIYCRRRNDPDAPEEILIDANALAAGHKYFRIGIYEPSPDNALLAFSTDTEGDESYVLQVKDLRTGELLPDRVPNTYYSVEWAADNRTLFYNVLNEAKRPFKLFRHELGSPAASDALVFHEPDEAFTLEVLKTKSGAYLLIKLESQTTSEWRYLDASNPEGTFDVIEPRRHEIEYDVAHQDGKFFLRVNDRGRNFRLVSAPVETPGLAHWTEIIPHRNAVMIERVDVFKHHLALVERENGLRRLRVFDPGADYYVSFPEPAYTVSLTLNPEYDTNLLRFVYTSLTTPRSTYDYDVATRTQTLIKREPVLGGYDPERYRTERLFATADDGARIPISLVYRKDLERNGQAPCFLTGYGAYGLSSEPAFQSERVSLLDRGFVVAIAHIRGGSEMGKPWHDAGRMLRKRHSFSDFIAAAEHIITEGYTSADQLGIMGRSAGGLLMGAVVNARPDLFRAVIAGVPFVDVLNTMSDATLPLTVGEYEEWGNPADARFYEYIRSYSPYDNLRAGSYPHMLVTAGLNDPRVMYFEPAKYVARLRTLKKDDTMLLLKTNMGAGHFGASGRYDKLEETAFEYAFLLKALGYRGD